EISKKMQDELSLRLGSSAIGLNARNSEEDTKKIQSETSSYVSRELIVKQKELIKILKEEFTDSKQVRIIISIDDLDKSWLSASAIRYDFINALLEAFRELLDIKSVKILISIRTDILMGIYQNSLRQDEKDQSLIYAISWDKDEIREIINSRVNQLVKN
ncbi:DNA repair protein, partial [Salmonella enterica subsp. enterica]|nr:DNA repair protein [Salmonella enterica subsp. enterica]